MFFKWILLFLFFLFTQGYPVPNLQVVTPAHRGAVGRISADCKGELILTCSVDKCAKLWDRDGNLLRTFFPPSAQGQDGMLYACALSPDGTVAAVGGRSAQERPGLYSVYLFSVSTGNMSARLSGLRQAVADLEFSTDGKYLAAGLYGSAGAVVFDVISHNVISRLNGFNGDVTGCSFDRSGKLVVACSDGTVRLFGAQFQEEGFFQTPDKSTPFSVVFSPVVLR